MITQPAAALTILDVGSCCLQSFPVRLVTLAVFDRHQHQVTRLVSGASPQHPLLSSIALAQSFAAVLGCGAWLELHKELLQVNMTAAMVERSNRVWLRMGSLQGA
jgi:hypothetical protein